MSAVSRYQAFHGICSEGKGNQPRAYTAHSQGGTLWDASIGDADFIIAFKNTIDYSTQKSYFQVFFIIFLRYFHHFFNIFTAFFIFSILKAPNMKSRIRYIANVPTISIMADGVVYKEGIRDDNLKY